MWIRRFSRRFSLIGMLVAVSVLCAWFAIGTYNFRLFAGIGLIGGGVGLGTWTLSDLRRRRTAEVFKRLVDIHLLITALLMVLVGIELIIGHSAFR